MNNNEKIQSFSDLVEAAQKLTKPWKILCGWLLAALVATNIIWGFVHFKQLQYAYMIPVEMEQGQDYSESTQNQSYSEGANNGG